MKRAEEGRGNCLLLLGLGWLEQAQKSWQNCFCHPARVSCFCRMLRREKRLEGAGLLPSLWNMREADPEAAGQAWCYLGSQSSKPSMCHCSEL